MIAQFQIILEGVTPLKIQCIDKFPDEKLKRRYIETVDIKKSMRTILKMSA
jgi:hypothetical protein